jgi:hypothetical protein
MALLNMTSQLVLQAVGILLAIYVFVTATYRLFFSRLSGLPGPKLAALTYWYECYYDVFQPAQYVFRINELHKAYGTLVTSATCP